MNGFFVQKNLIFLLLSVFCLLFFGCNSGPNTASVSGVITIDGKPEPMVEITFSPKDGQRSSVGYTNEKGAYTLRFTQDKYGCIPGDHVVRINAYRDPDDDKTQYLPVLYNHSAADNPELNITVKKGKQTQNFDVKLKN